MKAISCFTLFVAIVLLQIHCLGQDRSIIKNQIIEWENCRPALTNNSGDIVIDSYTSKWVTNNSPEQLDEILSSLREVGKEVIDISLTEEGHWLVVCPGNYLYYDMLPQNLILTIENMKKYEQQIKSVTFNDKGSWVIIGDQIKSSPKMDARIDEGKKLYGAIKCAHFTNNGGVLIFKKGFTTFGKVPSNVLEKLNATSCDIQYINYTDDGMFYFGDLNGHFEYNM